MMLRLRQKTYHSSQALVQPQGWAFASLGMFCLSQTTIVAKGKLVCLECQQSLFCAQIQILSAIQLEPDLHCHLPVRNLVILEAAAYLGDLPCAARRLSSLALGT
jgi:hypothetical protein